MEDGRHVIGGSNRPCCPLPAAHRPAAYCLLPTFPHRLPKLLVLRPHNGCKCSAKSWGKPRVRINSCTSARSRSRPGLVMPEAIFSSTSAGSVSQRTPSISTLASSGAGRRRASACRRRDNRRSQGSRSARRTPRRAGRGPPQTRGRSRAPPSADAVRRVPSGVTSTSTSLVNRRNPWANKAMPPAMA